MEEPVEMIEKWWLKTKENQNRVWSWKPNTDRFQEGGRGHDVNSTEKSRKIQRRKCLGIIQQHKVLLGTMTSAAPGCDGVRSPTGVKSGQNTG